MPSSRASAAANTWVGAAGQRFGVDADGVGTRRGDGAVRQQGQLLEAHEAGAAFGRGADTRRPAPRGAPPGRGASGVGRAPTRNGSRDRRVDPRRRGGNAVRDEHLDGHASAAGICWVMQCTPPPPYASTSPGDRRPPRDRRSTRRSRRATSGRRRRPSAPRPRRCTRRSSRTAPAPCRRRRSRTGSEPISTTSMPASSRRVLASAALAWFGLSTTSHPCSTARRGADERHDVVDVPVGAVVLRDAVAQPDDVVDAEPAAQLALDLRAVELRVAVGVEQASLRRDEQPVAVDRDRSALEHELGRVGARQPEVLGDEPTDPRVVVVGRERLAPRVEPEVDGAAVAIRLAHDDRTAVAEPRVVDRDGDDLDVGAAPSRRVVDDRRRWRSSAPARSGRSPPRSAACTVTGRVELAVPELIDPGRGGPTHHGALVSGPLRRHPRADGERRRHRSQPYRRAPAIRWADVHRRRGRDARRRPDAVACRRRPRRRVRRARAVEPRRPRRAAVPHEGASPASTARSAAGCVRSRR